MMLRVNKNKLAIGFAVMITLASPKAHAFGVPLMSADIGNLAASVKVIFNEIMIIKQEVDSNMRIIQEIRNGGFAAAGAMIFEKIQSGDYDRFGQSLKNVRSEGKNVTDNVKARKELKERERELREQGLDEKQARLQAQEEVKAKLEEERQKRVWAAEGRRMMRGENAGEKAYNWLKNNQSFTSGASSALRGLDNGNIGQVVSGAAGATGGAIGDNAVGNVFGSAASSAGSAVNSAINGDIGKVISNVGEGAGAGLGSATGSAGLDSAVGGVGNVIGGTYSGVSNADNLGDLVTGIANNSQINSGISGIESGVGQIDNVQSAAVAAEEQKKASEEAAKKAAEEAEKKALEEKTQKMLKEQTEQAKKDCMSCRASKGNDAIECSYNCGIAGM